MRRLPLIPTLLVAVAVVVMIGLGVWQLQRADEKDALIAQLEANRTLPVMALPPAAVADEAILFRRAAALCLEVVAWRQMGGKSASDQSGTRFIAECRSGIEGPGFLADMGVSPDHAATPSWNGGEVIGTVVREPGKDGLWARLFRNGAPARPMLISLRPAPGLEASRQPTPRNMVNNSLSYAIQWFFFAAIAFSIYSLALRRRGKVEPEVPRP